MIFGTVNSQKIWHGHITDLSTSPVRCSHFTLDKSVRFSCQIFSGFNVPKSLTSVSLWQSYSKNKRWTFFGDTVYRFFVSSHVSLPLRGHCVRSGGQWANRPTQGISTPLPTPYPYPWWSPYPGQIGEHVMLCWITVGRSGRCPRSRSDRRRRRKSCARATRAAPSRRRPEHSCLAPSTAGPPTPHGTCKTGGRSLRQVGGACCGMVDSWPIHATRHLQDSFVSPIHSKTSLLLLLLLLLLRYDTRC